MKKMLLLFILCFTVPFIISAQEVLQSFDAELDSSYFRYEISDNADSTKSFTTLTTITDEVKVGTGALQIDYSAHNSESWGGYTKIEHILPADGGVFDWSEFDSISFWYNNVTKQDLPGRVHVRFQLYDVSDVPDTTTSASATEFYYSFEYILDDDPGWKEFKLPLEASSDAWNGEAFNRTGWAGVPGNDKLDKDKIKGWGIEFSISGSGDGDASMGTIIFDHLTLKGSNSVMTISNNPGFEDGALTVWTGGNGNGTVEVKSGGAYEGDYYCEIGVLAGDNGWAAAWQDSVTTAGHKEEWLISAWIKDFSPEDPGGDFAALKLEAKAADNSPIQAWEDIQVGVTSEWQKFSTSHVLPEGTVYLTTTLVATRWDGAGKAAIYGFDNVALVKIGDVDDVAPETPANVTAVPNPGGEFNIITWDDVPGESGESYMIYASESPITDVKAPGVDMIAKVIEGTEQQSHFLIYPLEDKDVTFYYAVVCADASLNESEPGIFGPLTNTATGVPTISLDPPGDFAADGDLGEWENTDIMPWILKATENNVAAGTFDETDDDLTATVYLGMDDDYLYIACNVIDDVFSYDSTTIGNWWDNDAFEFFIGLWDRNGKPIHDTPPADNRGAEPDYKLIFVQDRYMNEFKSGIPAKEMTPADPNYYFEEFGGSDYVLEAKIPFDFIAKSGDNIFQPKNGMRIMFDLVFHDNDGGWQGNLTWSKKNRDTAWGNQSEWTYTWIGDTTYVATALEDNSPALVQDFNLSQNYPNPFNPQTTIEYSLATSATVNIAVYNTIGQKIATLVDTKQNAGVHLVKFNGQDLSSGLYFYQIEAGDFVQTRKMLLVK